MNKEKRVYELDYDLTERMFAELDGRHGNAIKIMIVLLGTDDSDDGNLTLTKIAGRTGMDKKAVMSSLVVLNRKGMLEYTGDVVKLKTDKLMRADHVESACRERRVYASAWDRMNNPTDKAIRRMLGEIGVDYLPHTKAKFEEAAGEPLDPVVLERIIQNNPAAWKVEERKREGYYYKSLLYLIETEYSRTKRQLENEA